MSENFSSFLREWGSTVVMGCAGVVCACVGWLLKLMLGEAWRVYRESDAVRLHTEELRGLREDVTELSERLVRVETLLEGLVERLDRGE